MTESQRGVVYVATGRRFVAEAVESARSVRAAMPGLPLVLFSDTQAPDGVFDQTLPVYNPQRSFIDKIEPLTRSPFERTLFLDTDTIMVRACEGLFDLLDQFDIAFAHEPGRFQYPISLVAPAYAEINTGVILFRRSPRVCRAFRLWRRFYARDLARNLKVGGKPYDQISFTQVIYRSGLREYVLGPEYNFRTVFSQSMAGPVHIVHGRNVSAHDLRRINFRSGVRAFIPNVGGLKETIAMSAPHLVRKAWRRIVAARGG